MQTKNKITVVVRRGQRNYGFALTVQASAKKIESALEQAFGKENILLCTIKEA